MRRQGHRLPTGLAAIALAVTGCTITPDNQVQPPRPTPETPATLAFDDTAVDPAGPTTANAITVVEAPTSKLLDDGQAGAWIQITNDATIGVHSAPDAIYTRLGVLEPGAGVVGTGRRADTGGTIWMEINWRDATAWVIAAAFSPV